MSWRELEEELARWRDAGRIADFWWRDDDATSPSSALQQLLRLSKGSAIPLALAVVPLEAAPELFTGLGASVLMHGTDHRNRAAPGEKKTEFPAAEPEAEALARLAAARERLARQAGGTLAGRGTPWPQRLWAARCGRGGPGDKAGQYSYRHHRLARHARLCGRKRGLARRGEASRRAAQRRCGWRGTDGVAHPSCAARCGGAGISRAAFRAHALTRRALA